MRLFFIVWTPRPNMTQAEEIASKINADLTRVKSGSLRLWGEWFGKPYDNVHQVIRTEGSGSLLAVHFDLGETLFVWAPGSYLINNEIFRIEDAARVRWEWFYYGRPQVAENRYFIDFEKTTDAIRSSTNIDWYTPAFQPDDSLPAAEIL